jgi:hypothetical protein
MVVAITQPTLAKPDFSQSTITAALPIVEGGVVTFLVTLRNTGDQDAASTQVQFELPLEGFFVDVEGLVDPTVDPRDKILTAALDLPSGGEHQFRVRMVVPPDTGGNLLMPDLRVQALYLGADFKSGAQFDIESRPDTSGFAVGGIRFNTPALVLLGVLLFSALLWLVLYSRVRSHGPFVAIALGIGFSSIFVALAWRDWQSIGVWKETTCTVLDSRLRVDSGPTTQPAARRRRNEVYRPLLALKYDVDGHEVISTGFETGSRLTIGGIGAAIEEASRWPIGASVPCWYDPNGPTDVVVIPGFGGAYIFAPLPLALLLFGVLAIRNPRRYR